MKLVRDRIPERIVASGQHPVTREVAGDELVTALKEKLVEEAKEALAAGDAESLVEELADVYEVLQALQREAGIEMSRVNDAKKKKWEERGGFEKGVILERVEEKS